MPLPWSLPANADAGLKDLAAAAQRYGQAADAAPGDYDAVYNHGLALQELATRLGSSQADQLALLSQVSAKRHAGLWYRDADQQLGGVPSACWLVILADRARSGCERAEGVKACLRACQHFWADDCQLIEDL